MKPLVYLEMDHEMMFKIVLVVSTLLVLLEASAIFLVYRTFCHPLRIGVINLVYEIHLDKSQFMKENSPIMMINLLLLFIPECVYRFVKLLEWFKKRKECRQIHPIPTISGNLNSWSAQNPPCNVQHDVDKTMNISVVSSGLVATGIVIYITSRMYHENIAFYMIHYVYKLFNLLCPFIWIARSIEIQDYMCRKLFDTAIYSL